MRAVGRCSFGNDDLQIVYELLVIWSTQTKSARVAGAGWRLTTRRGVNGNGVKF